MKMEMKKRKNFLVNFKFIPSSFNKLYYTKSISNHFYCFFERANRVCKVEKKMRKYFIVSFDTFLMIHKQDAFHKSITPVELIHWFDLVFQEFDSQPFAVVE